MKKILLVILDGVGDSGKKTPLELAKTPNLDTLVSISNAGLLQSVNEGIAPESDTALISILGNNLRKAYTGRGILEAVGSNIKVKKGELVLRANIEFIKDGFIKKSVKQKLSRSELDKVNGINPDVKLIP